MYPLAKASVAKANGRLPEPAGLHAELPPLPDPPAARGPAP